MRQTIAFLRKMCLCGTKTRKKPSRTRWLNKLKQLAGRLNRPAYVPVIGYTLLVLEMLLTYQIVERVPYTEIDWTAYMQECSGFLNGSRNYTELNGDTGPLVYPAGFVYIYSLLYLVTGAGTNIRLAQYIFLGIYLTQLWLTFRLYAKSGNVPPLYQLLVTFTSYRIHSIYVLRMFNDPVAVLLLYASLNLFIDRRWQLATFVYSLSVAIKMNTLLIAPAIFVYFVSVRTARETFVALAIGACTQLALAFPFVMTDAGAYLRRSFDFGRVFVHTWTVNYRFLPVAIFEHKLFHGALLVVHLIVLGLFAPTAVRCFRRFANGGDGGHDPKWFLFPVFFANFVGVTFARSLHYQFLSWYYHSLVFLVQFTRFPLPVRLLWLCSIEVAWNIYPSTNLSSLLLHGCHLLLIYGVFDYLSKVFLLKSFVNNTNFIKK